MGWGQLSLSALFEILLIIQVVCSLLVCLMQWDVHALLSPSCWDKVSFSTSAVVILTPNSSSRIAFSHLLFLFCCCRGFLASLRCAGCSMKHWLLLKLPISIYVSFRIYIFRNFESFILKYVILFCFHHSMTEVVCLFYPVLCTLFGEYFYPNTGRDIPTWTLECVQHLYTCFIPYWNKRFLLQKRAPVQKCKILIKAKTKKLNQTDLKNRKLCFRFEVFLVFFYSLRLEMIYSHENFGFLEWRFLKKWGFISRIHFQCNYLMYLQAVNKFQKHFHFSGISSQMLLLLKYLTRREKFCLFFMRLKQKK